jgi:hypothetical protein
LAPDDFSSEQELITFGGKGKYSDPEFVWIQPIGPTIADMPIVIGAEDKTFKRFHVKASI